MAAHRYRTLMKSVLISKPHRSHLLVGPAATTQVTKPLKVSRYLSVHHRNTNICTNKRNAIVPAQGVFLN